MAHQWVLETRVCKCGCSKTWRCLHTSKSQYALAHHNRQHWSNKEWTEQIQGIQLMIAKQRSQRNSRGKKK